MTDNRFQDFFEEGKYVFLKNHLYNYFLRKRTIEKLLARESYSLILEAGSGISPVMTQTDRIVYSELSFLACRTLKQIHGKGWYVVADVTRLPFRDGAFSHTIASEVLEHVQDDQTALCELARVMPQGGRLVVTFPHRMCYWANDDVYVQHFRRYERPEMIERLERAGLRPVVTRKILGPLERLTMILAVWCFETTQRLRGGKKDPKFERRAQHFAPIFKWANRAYACLAWLDARIVPQSLASVLLILAEKGSTKEPR